MVNQLIWPVICNYCHMNFNDREWELLECVRVICDEEERLCCGCGAFLVQSLPIDDYVYV